LPPPFRLALAYAPAAARADWLTLLTFEHRLSQAARSAREPMLGQIRLTWWRDRLGEPASANPRGEPLLARLADWGVGRQALAALVDGWEAVLIHAAPGDAVREAFIGGHCAACQALAAKIGAPQGRVEAAAVAWASHEYNSLYRLAGQVPRKPTGWRRLPRGLRPLGVLAVLSDPRGSGAGRVLRAGLVGLFGL